MLILMHIYTFPTEKKSSGLASVFSEQDQKGLRPLVFKFEISSSGWNKKKLSIQMNSISLQINEQSLWCVSFDQGLFALELQALASCI
jgi:hypothetical protein